ncbi:MAG: hypothetical protein KAR79_00845 [Simkaniaceae bacterium]|nr:hypothetical protein [Simkaniaceae bacterium]
MSISSSLISQITTFRNPNGPEQEWVNNPNRNPRSLSNVVIAEAGYLLVIPFAIVETALCLTIKLYSHCLSEASLNPESVNALCTSSSFSVCWAIADSILNLFCNDLIVAESVAIACALSGNPLSVPLDAH